MHAATTPSDSPAAPLGTSVSFPAPLVCAVGPSALSTVNPIGPKAAMAYAFHGTAWNENQAGDVAAYAALLVAVQNGYAADTAASAIRNHLAPLDSGESS